jgi:hypothetical protein
VTEAAAAKAEAKPAEEQAGTDTVTEAAAAKAEAKPTEEQADTDTVTEAAAKVQTCRGTGGH